MTTPYEIIPATFRDLNALRHLEKVCFPQDVWAIFDLAAVLTFPNVIRLKAVHNGKMIGFIAGDPRPSQGFSWIATIGVLVNFLTLFKIFIEASNFVFLVVVEKKAPKAI